ncbi:multicopper oxidase [Lentithecium fluviatile CBS 122367]|uniref:Multicopper oxidase n=1 Tax=Lentithecium fluviatile CBS 122367 TaxID=1168545 RepID=A0A6G1IRR7_9PLEO|nr:multicopper oxidase [Lentithecium fluviatile CBS 122367]
MHCILLLAAFINLAWAKTVTYDFEIGWVTAAPDGFSRPVIGINGQWPIPIIEANVGDTIVVKTRNSLRNETTSLHFHGMAQMGTVVNDGPVGVTQCPMEPGASYTYTFKACPAGTHWYHSHDKGQYPDGLRGKMIIHDPEWENSLNVTQQIPVSMSDWYHDQMPYLLDLYMGVNNTNGDIPPPNSFLFNDTTSPLAFNFHPGKRYLLRIVNMAALTCGQFHIEGHVLSIVAVDGVHVQAKDADTILVCAGQRYDAIVTGKSNPSTSEQFIAKMTTDMLTRPVPADTKLTVIGSATYLRINGLPITLNPSITRLLRPNWVPTAGVLDDTTLVPLDNQPLLRGVTKQITFRTNQSYYEGIGTRISVGAQPWVAPKVPSLYSALSTGRNAFFLSTYGPGVVPEILKNNDIVQIYMENPQPWPHPMHLHGHAFQVAGRGTGVWTGTEASLNPVPMKRDTVVIPPMGYLVLRFKADNPGVWFFHCHIDFHVVGGMNAVFIEAPDVLQRQSLTVPPSGIRLCKSAGQPPLGNCAGKTGLLSAAEAEEQCNTIFNMEPTPGKYGANDVYPR